MYYTFTPNSVFKSVLPFGSTYLTNQYVRVPWTARRSNQSLLKEIIPGISLEGMMLKLKLQYFGHLMWRTDSLEKTVMLGKTEGRMVGWHHRLKGHESEWTPGVGDGQGGLACYCPRGRKESDTTEQLNWTDDIEKHVLHFVSAVSVSNCVTVHLEYVYF